MDLSKTIISKSKADMVEELMDKLQKQIRDSMYNTDLIGVRNDSWGRETIAQRLDRDLIRYTSERIVGNINVNVGGRDTWTI